MEQVAIFSRGTADKFGALQEEINSWLEKNPAIEITSRQMNTVTGVNIEGNTFVNCTIVIFYRAKI